MGYNSKLEVEVFNKMTFAKHKYSRVYKIWILVCSFSCWQTLMLANQLVSFKFLEYNVYILLINGVCPSKHSAVVFAWSHCYCNMDTISPQVCVGDVPEVYWRDRVVAAHLFCCLAHFLSHTQVHHLRPGPGGDQVHAQDQLQVQVVRALLLTPPLIGAADTHSLLFHTRDRGRWII